MIRSPSATAWTHPLLAGLLSASLIGLSACSSDPEPVEMTSAPALNDAAIRSALGQITLDAAIKGQDVLGVRLEADQGMVNLHYAGAADRYVVCDPAGWLAPDGGVVDVDLVRSAGFKTVDHKGASVSIERWVRLDALSNVAVRAEANQLQVDPNIRYIVSMVTEVYDPSGRIGRKAERLEFDSGGSAVTSTGHRCESTGVLEDLTSTAAL